jgi:hypothetical protein
LNYFNYRNKLLTKTEMSAFREFLALATYGSLLLLVMVRLSMARRLPLDSFERFALMLYVTNGAFAAIFFTRVRYRLPFDLLLQAVIAIFAGRLLELATRNTPSGSVSAAHTVTDIEIPKDMMNP